MDVEDDAARIGYSLENVQAFVGIAADIVDRRATETAAGFESSFRMQVRDEQLGALFDAMRRDLEDAHAAASQLRDRAAEVQAPAHQIAEGIIPAS